ncbi:MAG: HAD family hydrolase [Dehalococcoidaceae bacterium]|nr:HAD family hydrolase [Dehalococcoidaceae bacterium]
MIKAVLFDLFNTLITYQPPREDIHLDILAKNKILIDKKVMANAIKSGDEFFYRENSVSLVKNRPAQEQKSVWYGYEATVLKDAGIDPEPSLIMNILNALKDVSYKMVLFDDVLPALRELKNKEMKLGIVSNIDRDIRPMCIEMGIMNILDIVLTSLETGLFKPSPEIFLRATAELNVTAGESLYAGDQYQIDVIGANRAGLTGVLVDRDGLQDSLLTNGYRVGSLSEIPALVRKINSGNTG